VATPLAIKQFNQKFHCTFLPGAEYNSTVCNGSIFYQNFSLSSAPTISKNHKVLSHVFVIAIADFFSIINEIRKTSLPHPAH
jgi:hypothetical protein